jgi:hypothetical protein
MLCCESGESAGSGWLVPVITPMRALMRALVDRRLVVVPSAPMLAIQIWASPSQLWSVAHG